MKNINLLNTENGLESTTISKEEVNNSNLYLDEKDSKGVPLLRRIEKYPDLPEDEFIPIEYPGIDKNKYKINKRGNIKVKTNKGYIDINGTINNGGYVQYSIIVYDKRKSVLLHRIIAFTFLINPNFEIYSIVNHIDHNKTNNNLLNLEWVSKTENSNRLNGRASYMDDKLLVRFIAMNDNKEDLFEITVRTLGKYNTTGIYRSIKHNCKYKGYFWRKINLNNKQDIEKIINYSGNIDDYKWYEHWKYPGIYVCREGFVRKDNKRIGSFETGGGYIKLSINKKQITAHRIIMEYILDRDLRDDEVVDHINTIKYDNSFSNLRVTDLKGNMNNPLTIEKLSKKLILTDLYGDYISYDTSKNLNKIIYKDFDKHCTKSGKQGPNDLIKYNFLADNYFCINLGNNEDLLRKMELVVYVFNSDKTKCLGAFDSGATATAISGLNRHTIVKYIKLNMLAPDGNYYLRGSEAVKLILSMGHGTALNFKI